MQTEAPRPDGGTGFPGLRLRGDVTGSADGLAMAPYIRETRRIRAAVHVVEQDLSLAVRGRRGRGQLSRLGRRRHVPHRPAPLDRRRQLHRRRRLPVRDPARRAAARSGWTNLLAAGKNIGTTHITNGCYRLHPVEWNVGEVAGTLAAHCLDSGKEPAQVRSREPDLRAFQQRLLADGVELHWPQVTGY